MNYLPPPAGYLDLGKAFNTTDGSFGNLIGTIVDVLPPIVNAKSGQHQFTFKLLDSKLRDSVYGSQGYTVRFWRNDANLLPKIKCKGDIVLLKNVKLTTFSGQPLALSNFQTTALVFPRETIPDPSYQIAFYGAKTTLPALGAQTDIDALTAEVQHYVIQLKDALKRIPELSGPSATEDTLKRKTAPTELATDRRKLVKSSVSNKFQLVQELQHMRFADMIVEVARKFPNQYGVELYVSDYTENRQMWLYDPPEDLTAAERDGDQYGYSGQKRRFNGPWGQFVLKVNVKQPHAAFANSSVNEGDLVLLRNVKMKIMSEGSKLEGDMWPDSMHPEKVQIQKIRSNEIPEVQALLKRKKNYWSARAAKGLPCRDGTGAAVSGDGQPKKNSRGEKRRAKKDKKLLAQQAAADKALQESNTSGRNQHIHCRDEDVPLSSLHTILDPHNFRHTNKHPTSGESYVLPFVNARYRTRVNVLDFDPPNIEDFAVHAQTAADEPKSMFSPDMDWELSQKWEWSFSLLVSDGQDSMWVNVLHEDAQFLLGNDMKDPDDLRQDRQLLAKLREKLFFLWNDLEEQKREGRVELEPNGRPFECCLEEYGVQDGDQTDLKAWTRQYSLFGTTIR